MTLVQWEPFRDLLGIQERSNRVLADSSSRLDEGHGAWVPPVDIFEKGDHLVIRAEMPGLDRDDIDIRVENGVLHMRGERKHDPELEDKSAHRVERVYGSFTRSFTLPTTVDATNVAAKYRDGVLEIAIPKAESAKARKVRIETA